MAADNICSSVTEENRCDEGVNLAFNKDILMERIDGDVELLREIVDLFLAERPRMMEEIAAAIRDHDAHGLRRAAHTLKGSASNFAADRVVSTALALEIMGREGNLHLASETRDLLEQVVGEFEDALSRFARLHSESSGVSSSGNNSSED